MGENSFMLMIAALLPLTGGLLVLQKDPYRALVIRGVLGALAALAYALFGAADVALTEALVGTMLSITLYAIAVRSSMSVKIGILKTEQAELALAALEAPLTRHHLSCKVLA
ncbi:MAG: hydrogenase subunit MbhD domain-containing protein, partial [Phormidesmis sp.]